VLSCQASLQQSNACKAVGALLSQLSQLPDQQLQHWWKSADHFEAAWTQQDAEHAEGKQPHGFCGLQEPGLAFENAVRVLLQYWVSGLPDPVKCHVGADFWCLLLLACRCSWTRIQQAPCAWPDSACNCPLCWLLLFMLRVY
jgi:hypothetical protein